MAQGKKKILETQIAADETISDVLPDLVGTSIASAASSYSRGAGQSAQSSCAVWPNLDALGLPFKNDKGYFNVKDAVVLCQKAYYRIGIFKTAIDTMADLCNTDLHFYEGNAQSLKFFESWSKKINIWNLKDQFFRECFRSGNIFLYEAALNLKASDVFKLSQNYAKNVKIPGRYIVLNPANFCVELYDTRAPIYSQILSKTELERMKNADLTEETVYKDIKSAIDKYVGSGHGGETIVQIDPAKLHTVFYQKQDYEPFAVPMGFCVLDDLNLLIEMKKADLIASKSVEYMMLLITMGAKKEDGGTNPKAMEMLKNAFKKDQLGRALVADYTTEAQFVTPDLTKILAPDKYNEIKSNIANGLTNIFFGEQKFANVMAKLKVFVKKLENAQQLFINEFLQPEIKRISKLLNFKSYPKVEFEPINLEDQTNFLRIVAQLMTLGTLTAKDGLEIMETGLYPSYDELIINQKNYKADRDAGLFQPIQGGPADQLVLQKEEQKHQLKMQALEPKPAAVVGKPGVKAKPKTPTKSAGRPSGTKSPQTTKKVSPVGASIAEEYPEAFSQRELVDNTILAFNVEESVEDSYKKEYNKKKLTATDKKMIEDISDAIIWNSEPSEWISRASNLDMPEAIQSNLHDIMDIQNTYNIENPRLAAILFHSRVQ